jgi:hypothetical protein
MRRILLCFLLPFVTLSCSKVAKVKLPAVKAMPVIYAFLSPADTVIRVKLTLSQPLFDPNHRGLDESVDDAQVFLSSAQGEVSLMYNANKGYYEIKAAAYPIQPGGLYKIRVRLSDGTEAGAETKVPSDFVPIGTLTLSEIDKGNVPYYRIKLSFTDNPAVTNYYCLMHSAIYTYPSGTYVHDSPDKLLHSDINRNGEVFELNIDSYRDTAAVSRFRVYFLNCNYDYFQFYKSISNYSGGGPFSEPSLTYSNIKGGFGVFAAYTASIDSL